MSKGKFIEAVQKSYSKSGSIVLSIKQEHRCLANFQTRETK
jgi:hypothetical protein